MEIAIIAHDAKKELMVQFCIAYCGVLAKHHICATKATGKMVSDATGLEIEQLLPGRQGGIDQIMSRIAYNEIDILLYFRDNNTTADFNELLTDSDLVRECDIHNTPVATNIATAELLFIFRVMKFAPSDPRRNAFGKAKPMVLFSSFILIFMAYSTKNSI